MKTIKFLLVSLAVFCLILSASAQSQLAMNSMDASSSLTSSKLLTSVPTFKGGTEKLAEYFNENLHYPMLSKIQGIEGKVLVEFNISETGEIRNIKVLKSLTDDLDREAIRLVRNMPHWQPAYQNGIAQNVNYQLPILFRLD
ncbi:energy transducer TonB [Algoriphagus aestuarii]|nr:energy transducer TonB [Algoriphagus aestuarii]